MLPEGWLSLVERNNPRFKNIGRITLSTNTESVLPVTGRRGTFLGIFHAAYIGPLHPMPVVSMQVTEK